MAFRDPVPGALFAYTTGEPATVALQPGRLRVHGEHEIARQRLEFQSIALGPTAGNATARWLRNGTTLGTITVLQGAADGSIAPPTDPALHDGDLLTFEVLGLGAATGAIVGMLDI